MEIAPAPRRPAWTSPRWLTLIVVVLGPVTLLAVLPAALGLQRYVLTSDDVGSRHGRGALVFERATPVGDVQVGDVVTFQAPPVTGRSGLMTREVASVGGGQVVTRSRDADRPDVQTIDAEDQPVVGRAVFTVPLVGYALLADVGRPAWLLLVLAAAGLLVGLILQDLRGQRAHGAGLSTVLGRLRPNSTL